MTEQLLVILQKVREGLNSDPDGIIYGELNVGKKDINNDNPNLQQYFHFLKEANGGRFGGIDLWSYSELDSNQYRVSDLNGGIKKWIEIGQIIYEPLVINKQSGEVYHFYQGHLEDMGHNLGMFNSFIIDYVFGNKYEKIVPDSHSDEWYQFLKRIELV
ncbi:hypothetical protein [Paenibacillus kribbensis]|uniref:hypothetical protein n=1 Tax=Paenibacillus kribbensis TaxID=172713 RepID=UPI0015BCBBA9|nr:hypothetical protein [Paenibacillus kribbensis]